MQYTIRNVNRRGEWRSRYATTPENDMVDWAISLDGETGWIKLTQKITTPPPEIGRTIEGRIEDKTSTNGEPYRAFKKENQMSGSRSGQGDTTRMEQRLEYAINILEELAGVKPVGDVAMANEEPFPPEPGIEDPFPDL